MNAYTQCIQTALGKKKKKNSNAASNSHSNTNASADVSKPTLAQMGKKNINHNLKTLFCQCLRNIAFANTWPKKQPQNKGQPQNKRQPQNKGKIQTNTESPGKTALTNLDDFLAKGWSNGALPNLLDQKKANALCKKYSAKNASPPKPKNPSVPASDYDNYLNQMDAYAQCIQTALGKTGKKRKK
jgi:hypothetical protein